MNLKSVVTMEIERNGKVYVFSMPSSAPLGEAYDVTFQFLQEIIKLSHQAAEKASPKNNEDLGDK